MEYYLTLLAALFVCHPTQGHTAVDTDTIKHKAHQPQPHSFLHPSLF